MNPPLANYWQWAYSEDECQSVQLWLFHIQSWVRLPNNCTC